MGKGSKGNFKSWKKQSQNFNKRITLRMRLSKGMIGVNRNAGVIKTINTVRFAPDNRFHLSRQHCYSNFVFVSNNYDLPAK